MGVIFINLLNSLYIVCNVFRIIKGIIFNEKDLLKIPKIENNFGTNFSW